MILFMRYQFAERLDGLYCFEEFGSWMWVFSHCLQKCTTRNQETSGKPCKVIVLIRCLLLKNQNARNNFGISLFFALWLMLVKNLLSWLFRGGCLLYLMILLLLLYSSRFCEFIRKIKSKSHYGVNLVLLHSSKI